ncbi:MAG: lipid-A-disaccharide synthase [Cyanobacteria bacterium J06626_18]
MTQRDRLAAVESPLRILISTGEVSGDLQGSLLIRALHRQAQHLGCTLQIAAIGGPRMAKAGAHLIADTTGIGSVGIFEALPFLFPTLKIQKRVRQYLQHQSVDLVLFIDYMNPNLSLGRFLRKTYPNLPTAYYIAPQQWVWAFSEKDTQALVGIADKMVAVFPQEADYYRQFGANTAYFGHPLVDQLTLPPDRTIARNSLGLAPDAQVITLLPASRWQEVKYVLPIMLTAAEQIQKELPKVQFLIPVALGKLRPRIERSIAQSGITARIIEGSAHAAIAAADLVLNKSGTVNLEVALINVPQVVVYRLNPLTAWIAYHLLKLRIEHVSPVNLLVRKTIVPEFVQWHATVSAITAASLKLLQDPEARATILAGYDELRQQMGQPGVCDRVAADLLTFALQP